MKTKKEREAWLEVENKLTEGQLVDKLNCTNQEQHQPPKDKMEITHQYKVKKKLNIAQPVQKVYNHLRNEHVYIIVIGHR